MDRIVEELLGTLVTIDELQIKLDTTVNVIQNEIDILKENISKIIQCEDEKDTNVYETILDEYISFLREDFTLFSNAKLKPEDYPFGKISCSFDKFVYDMDKAINNFYKNAKQKLMQCSNNFSKRKYLLDIKVIKDDGKIDRKIFDAKMCFDILHETFPFKA